MQILQDAYTGALSIYKKKLQKKNCNCIKLLICYFDHRRLSTEDFNLVINIYTEISYDFKIIFNMQQGYSI